MKINIKKTCIVLYLFALIFAPPIIPFNIIYILFIIACIGLIKLSRNSKKYVHKSFLMGTIWLLYVLVVILMNEIFSNYDLLLNRITVLYQIFLLIPMQIVCALFVCKFCEYHNISFNQLVDLCILAGLIEGICVMVAFLLPSVRNLFLNLMIRNGQKSVYTDELMSYRAYGFADTLLDTFGYGMGILSGCCILKDKIELKDWICCFLFLFSTAVNSRTGLAIFLVFVVVKIINLLKNGKISYRFFLYIAEIFIFVGLASFFIKRTELKNTTTFKWIISGFRSVYNFLTKTEGTYTLGSMQNSLLSKNFYHLPTEGLAVLLGKGHSCYGSQMKSIYGYASDVGYINYIWICGIIGLIALMAAILKIFISVINHATSNYMKALVVGLATSFFVMFFKGNVITYTAGTVLTILITMGSYKYGNANKSGG